MCVRVESVDKLKSISCPRRGCGETMDKLWVHVMHLLFIHNLRRAREHFYGAAGLCLFGYLKHVCRERVVRLRGPGDQH